MPSSAGFTAVVVLVAAACGVVAARMGLFRVERWMENGRGMFHLAAAFFVFVGLVAASGGMLAVVRTPGQAVGEPMTARQQALVVTVGSAAAAVLALVMMRLVRRVDAAQCGPGSEPVRVASPRVSVGWGALWLPVPIAVAFAGSLIYTLVKHESPPPEGHVLLKVISDKSEPLVWRCMLIGGAVVLAPIVEEVIYRGLLLPGLVRTSRSTWSGVLLTSVLFTAVHYGSVPAGLFVVAGPTLFALALGLALVYVRTRSLVAPIALHVLFNAFNIGVLLLGGG